MKARVIVAAALAALYGCGGDSTGPSGTSGTITFTFAGGTFTVTGATPSQTSGGTTATTYVAGSIDATAGTTGQTFIIGNKSLGNSNSDVIVVGISRATVGSSSVATNCDPEGTNCSGVIFLQNLGGSSGTYDAICGLDAGTVAITEVTSTRVKGTFSGTGDCINASNQTSAFTVTNGTFDVALVAGLM